MKKNIILSLLLGLLLLSFSVFAQDIPNQLSCREQVFKITAYYSPAQGQQFYLRPDYTAEIKLNGRGIHGASGKPVFDGMIAAPRSYEFGSQIILPGLGTGEVADRGGAIVAGSGVDRIDIWAGKGEIGLERAKSIGNITMTGFVCSGGTISDGLGINRDLVPDYQNFIDVAVWSVDQSIGRADTLVKKLQEHFFKMGYADDFTDGVYDEKMEKIVCNFQQNTIGMSGDDSNCGVFGPQTRATLMQKMIQTNILDKKWLYQTTNYDRIHPVFRANRRLSAGITVETNPETKKLVIQFEPLDVDPPETQKNQIIKKFPPITTGINSTKTASKILSGTGKLEIMSGSKVKNNSETTTIRPLLYGPIFLKPWYLGEKRDDVRDLKMILQREKLYKGTIDKLYNTQTRMALTSFQKKYKLIDNSTDPKIIGVAGPATRKLLEKMR